MLNRGAALDTGVSGDQPFSIELGSNAVASAKGGNEGGENMTNVGRMQRT